MLGRLWFGFSLGFGACWSKVLERMVVQRNTSSGISHVGFLDSGRIETGWKPSYWIASYTYSDFTWLKIRVERFRDIRRTSSGLYREIRDSLAVNAAGYADACSEKVSSNRGSN